MRFFDDLERGAAIRFRRYYLETLSASRMSVAVALRLSLRLSMTVANSKVFVAGSLMMFATVLFTVPFGTHEIGTAQRYAFLTSSFLVATVLSWALILPAYFCRLKGWIGDRALVTALVSIISVCSAGTLALADDFLAPSLDIRFWPTLARLFPLFFLEFWLSMTLTTFRMEQLLRRNTKGRSLVNKLPRDKQGKLVSLSAQDHYVEITTTIGSELVRMKMADALKEVEPGIGMKIHRSHWVAISAIKVLDESRRTVELIDGRSLPVSEAQLPSLVLKLSRIDDLPENPILLSTDYSGRNLVLKLRNQHNKIRKDLDAFFLDAFRGKPVDTRTAFRIARLQHQASLTSPVYLVLFCMCFFGPILMGSYGSYELSFGYSLLYWLAITVVCAPVVLPSHVLCHFVGLRYGLRGGWVSFGMFVTEATLASLLMYLTKLVMAGEQMATLGQFMFGVYCMNLILNLYLHVNMRDYRSLASWQRRMSFPPIVLQLPFEKRGDLISLSANGRYVDVTTTAGTGTLRMRFRDAVERKGTTKGVQVHRSHWVAAEHLRGRRVENGKNFVEVSSGVMLPMSAARAPDVDELLQG